MIKKKKVAWPKLSIYIGSYKLESVKQPEAKPSAIKSFIFGEMIFQKHDLRQVLGDYYKSIGVQWPYAHQNNLEELFHSKRFSPKSRPKRRLLLE